MAEAATPEQIAEALGDIREEVMIKKKIRVITPLRTRQFFDVLKSIYKLTQEGVVDLRLVTSALEKPGGVLEVEAVEKLKREFDPFKMIACGGDHIIRIVAAGTGLSVSEVESLDPLDMVRATAAVFKVNLDFFFRNGAEIKAALAPLWEAVKTEKALETVGLAPSPDSSEPATA